MVHKYDEDVGLSKLLCSTHEFLIIDETLEDLKFDDADANAICTATQASLSKASLEATADCCIGTRELVRENYSQVSKRSDQECDCSCTRTSSSDDRKRNPNCAAIKTVSSLVDCVPSRLSPVTSTNCLCTSCYNGSSNELESVRDISNNLSLDCNESVECSRAALHSCCRVKDIIINVIGNNQQRNIIMASDSSNNDSCPCAVKSITIDVADTANSSESKAQEADENDEDVCRCQDEEEDKLDAVCKSLIVRNANVAPFVPSIKSIKSPTHVHKNLSSSKCKLLACADSMRHMCVDSFDASVWLALNKTTNTDDKGSVIELSGTDDMDTQQEDHKSSNQKIRKCFNSPNIAIIPSKDQQPPVEAKLKTKPKSSKYGYKRNMDTFPGILRSKRKPYHDLEDTTGTSQLLCSILSTNSVGTSTLFIDTLPNRPESKDKDIQSNIGTPTNRPCRDKNEGTTDCSIIWGDLPLVSKCFSCANRNSPSPNNTSFDCDSESIFLEDPAVYCTGCGTSYKLYKFQSLKSSNQSHSCCDKSEKCDCKNSSLVTMKKEIETLKRSVAVLNKNLLAKTPSKSVSVQMNKALTKLSFDGRINRGVLDSAPVVPLSNRRGLLIATPSCNPKRLERTDSKGLKKVTTKSAKLTKGYFEATNQKKEECKILRQAIIKSDVPEGQ
ncbi:unnamed protein product [Phyllotreta striolata]|uniref:Uncharacterized protein n=1 Tax=Phyllotreta striolata TaxID=444603 RepID=A0A9N9TP53_PHYSR|nr:unnamed protein product [Phyllotreta striolata]